MFGRAKRSKMVLCMCRNCTSLNPHTGMHEGKMIPRATRDSHTQDDKIHTARQKAEAIPRTHPQFGTGSTAKQEHTFQFNETEREAQSERIRLIEEEVKWLAELPVTSPTIPLVFKHNPRSNGKYQFPSDADIVRPNHGLHALKTSPRVNAAFLRTEHRYCELLTIIQAEPNLGSDDAEDATYLIRGELERMCHEKAIQWAQQRVGITSGPALVNTEIHFYPRGPRNLIQKASAVVSLVMENIFFTPRRALRAQLAGIRDILRTSGISPEIIEEIPKTPSSASTPFRLDPVTRKFISCPTCFCLYPYNPGDNPNDEDTPAISCCTFKQTPTSLPCEEPLWYQRVFGANRPKSVPRRIHLHQDLKSWLGRLLSREGMEELLDSPPYGPPPHPDTPIDDIWLSEVFLNLKGPSGEPFYPGKSGEGRLVFGLSVDGFNPFHMKTAKQTASSTGVWLVLLNLPPHLRYLPENMFHVCTIPGPGKPSASQINHALQLLVDDLLEFWTDGVYFSRTYKHRVGRLFRAMLVPLIADMMAVRQVIGLPGVTTAHYFCTFCDIDYDDINILDRTEWPSKNAVEFRRFATLWKGAQSEKHQLEIFQAFGVRWSALLDLPYWNPVLYSVIDSMHALDLNLFQNHVRNIFKINLLKPGSDDEALPDPFANNNRVTSSAEKASLKKCIKQVYENDQDLLYKLLSHERRVLYAFCVDNGVIGEGHKLVIGTRWILARNITLWRQAIPGDPTLDAFLLRAQPKPMPAATFEMEEGYDSLWASDDEDVDMDPPHQPEDNLPDINLKSEEGRPGNGEPTVDPDGLPPDIQPDDGAEDLPADNGDPRQLPEAEGIDLKLVRRIIGHLINESDAEDSRRKAFTQSKIPLLRYIGLLLGLPHIEPHRGEKKTLLDAIIKKIDNDEDAFELLASYHTPKPSNHAVLGKDIMEAVWADMKRTQLPSWIGSVPHNWGTAERGKLNADNWRVICTIHLPITLIRLWRHETGRRMAILQNFMDLVSAVRIANMRVSSPNQVIAYNRAISCYVAGLQALYPNHKLKPTHHAALHIGDILELFGPVHSHSAPFFERYINFLHRVNTNQKSGDLEGTFMRAAAKSANLRAILAEDEEIREVVLEMVRVMEATAQEDIRGFRRATMLDPHLSSFIVNSKATPFHLPDHEHQLFRALVARTSHDRAFNLSAQGLSVDEVSLHGVCYGTSGSSKSRNSTVLFQPQTQHGLSESGSLKAGVIQTIFQHTHHASVDQHQKPVQGIYVVVREHPYMDPADDPYRRFGFSGGFLCAAEAIELHVIALSQIVSHFALTRFEGEFQNFFHAMPLDRLMLSFEFDTSQAEELGNDL